MDYQGIAAAYTTGYSMPSRENLHRFGSTGTLQPSLDHFYGVGTGIQLVVFSTRCQPQYTLQPQGTFNVYIDI